MMLAHTTTREVDDPTSLTTTVKSEVRIMLALLKLLYIKTIDSL